MNTSTISVAKHEVRCKICNHKQRNEIEKQYLEGDSPYQIVKVFPDLKNDIKCVYRHVKVLGLDKQRDDSTLFIVNKIIDRGNSENIEVSPGVLMDALKLRAKLKGEIIDKQEIDDKSNAKHKSTKQLDAEIVEIIGESEGPDRESDAGEAATG